MAYETSKYLVIGQGITVLLMASLHYTISFIGEKDIVQLPCFGQIRFHGRRDYFALNFAASDGKSTNYKEGERFSFFPSPILHKSNSPVVPQVHGGESITRYYRWHLTSSSVRIIGYLSSSVSDII